MGITAETGFEGWLAELRLGFRGTGGKTLLWDRQRKGPLAVQRAFYPEGDPCHVYLLHPPGGVAGGDQLSIHVALQEGAKALITTPGATKFYRSIGPAALQEQRLKVMAGTLEWLPQENILFPGTNSTLVTEVELGAEASFIGWEINCLGRPAAGERFEQGQASFSFSLTRGGEPLLRERMRIASSADLESAAGLRGQPVFASLYATGCNPGMLDAVRLALPPEQQSQLGVTLLDDLLVARYLGHSTEIARRCLTRVWATLRPMLCDRPACEPRIWNT